MTVGRVRLGAARVQRLDVAAAVVITGVMLAPWAPLAAAGLAVGVATAMACPLLGLLAAAWAVPFGSAAALPMGAVALTPAPVLLALTAFGWALSAAARRRLPVVPAAGRVVLSGLAVFVAGLALSALAAPDIAAGGAEVVRWGLLGLALALAAALGPRRGVVLAVAILAAGAAEAAVGAAMAVQRVGPEAFAVLGGRIYRAHGTFGQPNPFAGYMNMVWPVGLALAWTALVGDGARARGGPPRTRLPLGRGLAVFGAGAAGLCGVALVLSWSRGGWLAAAAGGGTMALAWVARAWGGRVARRRSLAVAWAASTLGVALLLAGAVDRIPAGIGDRLGSISRTFAVWGVADAEVTDANFATVERVAHWEAAAAMWAERPWLGHGPGTYAEIYPRFRLPRWSDPLGHAHNIYLHLLAESGLVGLACYFVFFGAALAAILRAVWHPTGQFEAALGLGLAGVWGALAFHSLLDNLYVHDMTIHLGLLLGVLSGQRGRAPALGGQG